MIRTILEIDDRVYVLAPEESRTRVADDVLAAARAGGGEVELLTLAGATRAHVPSFSHISLQDRDVDDTFERRAS